MGQQAVEAGGLGGRRGILRGAVGGGAPVGGGAGQGGSGAQGHRDEIARGAAETGSGVARALRTRLDGSQMLHPAAHGGGVRATQRIRIVAHEGHQRDGAQGSVLCRNGGAPGSVGTLFGDEEVACGGVPSHLRRERIGGRRKPSTQDGCAEQQNSGGRRDAHGPLQRTAPACGGFFLVHTRHDARCEVVPCLGAGHRAQTPQEAGAEGAVGQVVADAVGVFAEEAAEVRFHGGNAPGGMPAR